MYIYVSYMYVCTQPGKAGATQGRAFIRRDELSDDSVLGRLWDEGSGKCEVQQRRRRACGWMLE